MPGPTTYLGENPNDFRWVIPRGKGKAFEDLIEKYLRRYVATRNGSVRVHRTRATGDAGRDFEIRFSEGVTLFGVTVPAPSLGHTSVVFVECKSTEHERLDDAFIIDASQHYEAESSAYFLVTNAVITPYCHYRAQREWQRLGTNFYLVDRRRLVEALIEKDMAQEGASLGLPLPNPAHLPRFDTARLVVSCQTEQHPSPNGQTAHLFVVLAHYGAENVLADVTVATDLRWLPQQKHYERIVAPATAETLELRADRQEYDGPADLGLTLSVNGRAQSLTVSQPNYHPVFEPPFVGRSHWLIAEAVRNCVENTRAFSTVSVQGEAGVGKTRTVAQALQSFAESQWHRFTYYFSQSGVSAFDDFEDTFGSKAIRTGAPDAPSRIAALLQLAAGAAVPLIIQFEDLHHAADNVIKIFKEAILRPPRSAGPVLVILTGRDDHTFPNEEYYSLLQLVADQSREDLHSFVVSPLTDDDSRLLIRSVVQDIPDPGVERVRALGQNNPFIIVEFLQYLLDIRLAQLLSRRTVGILNPELFAGRDGLPETVEELYDKRLASLGTQPAGVLAYEFLVVASFFGIEIGGEIRRTFFDGEQMGEQAWSLLCARRFVKEDPSGDLATFAHENLLHHMRREARRAENSRSAAALVLDREGICRRLNRLDLGEVRFLYGDHAAAFECLDEVWERIQAITNFSSEEIARPYFRYLPALFCSGLAIGKPKELLAKIAVANGYMGVHNYPLVIADDACLASLDMLQKIYPKREDGSRQKLAIAQLHAHALQNMGRTGAALKEMLEIESAIREHKRHWPEVEFDLYDRLQEYYRKINHGELVRFYGHMARSSVDRADDEKLLSAHLITHSLAGLFAGEREAQSRADEAHRVAKRVGVQRFVAYTRLTQLVVQTLYANLDSRDLCEVAGEARRMLRDAAVANFSDSIMRLELLLGTLSLNTQAAPSDRHARARAYIKSGLANSVRYGNGLFDWAFDNLAAIVDLNDPGENDDAVRRRFSSCLERLRVRGLTFLGAESGTYPNAFAVSNIIRFFGQYQESRAVELLKATISTYKHQSMDDERLCRDLVRRAVKGHPIFWPTPRFRILRYPHIDGYFTPVF